jgi:hypothetical protein
MSGTLKVLGNTGLLLSSPVPYFPCRSNATLGQVMREMLFFCMSDESYNKRSEEN